MAQTPFLNPSDFPRYMTMSVPDDVDEALCTRATSLIVARYNRTPEMHQIVGEIVSVTPDNRAHLANTPVATLDSSLGDTVEARYSAGVLPWGYMFGAPQWNLVNPQYVDINPQTGMVWVSSGLFNVPYSELRVTYRSGFCPVGGPYPEWLKSGTAKLIENILVRSGTTMVKAAQVADQQQVEFFDQSLFDLEVRSLLSPLEPHLWG